MAAMRSRVAVMIIALASAAALSGCVDKTPPPLWPTPPPPPMATPIGDPGGATASTAAPAPAAVGTTPALGTAAPVDPPPGGLGPWQPGRDQR